MTAAPTVAARAPASPLHRLLYPSSVAVVGASPNHRWGRIMLENLRTIGYRGAVFAVNPGHDEIDGVPCFPTITDLPAPPDAVLVGVRRERVLPVLEGCAEVGAGGAVVVGAGFAELGAEGRELQDRLADVARRASLPVVGPNCMGLINLVQPCALYLDLVRARLEPGSVALVSHSGTVVQALTNNPYGVRFSFVVSSGNEAVTGLADLIEFFVADEHTKVIVLVLEAIREPERLVEACERAAATGKPVVAVKIGRSEGAQQAALAHSGALATSDRLVDALFRHCGVLRVDTLEELLSTAAVLLGRTPRGRGVGALTQSGGQVGLLLDGAEQTGLEFAELDPRTVARLKSRLSPGVRISNPLDAWGLGESEHEYTACLAALAADPGVDVLLQVIESRVFPTGESESLEATLKAVEEVAAGTDKPIVFVSSLSGDIDPDVQARLAGSGVPVVAGLRVSLRAVERALAFHAVERPEPARPRPKLDGPALLAGIDGLGGKPRSGLTALELVSAMGIPVVETRLARTEEEAVEAAESIGFPIVLKTGNPEVLHKTELGALHLDLRDAEAVRRAFRSVKGSAIVQRHVQGGIELILGLHAEPPLGTFVIVGLGGVWAEAVDDVSIRAVALRAGEALEMLGELKGAELLHSARRNDPVSLPSVVDSLERLAAAGELIGGRIRSLDVNPLIVSAHGVLAVDAVVVPADA